jgi:hypothetical protein
MGIRHEVPPDGFCMFHSISLYLGRDDGRQLLNEVADYMNANQQGPVMQTALSSFLLEDAKARLESLKSKTQIRTLSDYIAKFRTGRLWAGAVELQITSAYLGRSIQVCRGDPDWWEQKRARKKQRRTRQSSDEADRFVALLHERANPPQGETDEVIYIVYNGSNHYEGLVSVQLIA